MTLPAGLRSVDAITDVHATWSQRTDGGANAVPRSADEALLAHVQRFSFDAQSTALGLALDALVDEGDGRAVD